jgi:hypothetical protein
MSARTGGVAALLAVVALLASAPGAIADGPTMGFTDRGAALQRTYEQRFVRGISADAIRRTSRALSRRPRLTGTSGAARALRYSVRRLHEYGLDVSIHTYRVYGPRHIAVTMTAPYTRPLATTERVGDVVTAYNAYSPTGDVSEEVVYANRSLPRDYAELERLGVDVRGRIVLVRYGGAFRGVKAQQAEERGAKGVLLYSDPADDGFTRGPVYPDGPWRPADGIQRGTIQYLFRYPGDPLTPGAASLPGTRRLAPADAANLPRIPTTPISYGDARPLLEALGGPVAPASSRGGLPITYRVGQGLLGSTEWVEQFQRRLRRGAVPYANLDQAAGTRFYASDMPQLDDALIDATKSLADPRSGRSVYASGRRMSTASPSSDGWAAARTTRPSSSTPVCRPSTPASAPRRAAAPTTRPTTTPAISSGISTPGISGTSDRRAWSA